ncbi:MAG: glycosyltransferase, partial [Ignavibacteriales bacterium]
HCGSEIDTLSDILNIDKKKFFVFKHPDFPSEILDKNIAIERLNKKYFKDQLKADDKIFLMFGAIAEYKGIMEVIEIFKTLDERNKLVIAGFVKKGNHLYYNQIKNFADDKIFIEGSNIPDEDVPLFLNSADYLIFNYSNILTSGGVVLAMNYNKKIITPILGCIKEIDYPHLIKFNRKNITLEQVIHSL